jgi:hypothetical protein
MKILNSCSLYRSAVVESVSWALISLSLAIPYPLKLIILLEAQDSKQSLDFLCLMKSQFQHTTQHKDCTSNEEHRIWKLATHEWNITNNLRTDLQVLQDRLCRRLIYSTLLARCVLFGVQQARGDSFPTFYTRPKTKGQSDVTKGGRWLDRLPRSGDFWFSQRITSSVAQPPHPKGAPLGFETPHNSEEFTVSNSSSTLPIYYTALSTALHTL